MTEPVIDPSATNPDKREGVDPSVDPNQVQNSGNPAPKEPPARDPNAAKPEDKKEDKKPEDNTDPKPEDKKEEPSDDTPLDVSTWGSTSSETGDAVLTLLQNSGLKPEDAKALLFDAVQAGDVTKIDKAALEAKVGKTKAHLILVGATAFVTERRTAAQAIVSDLHKEVGGEANWKTIAEWANKSVEAEELDQYREMINKGGLPAKVAAKALKDAYEGDKNNSSLSVQEVLPGAKPGDAPLYKPMSKVEYAKQLEELNRKHFGNPPVHLRQALLTARQRGQTQGL